MKRNVEPASELVDVLLEEVIRLLRFQLRVVRLEYGLERLREREERIFRAFHAHDPHEG